MMALCMVALLPSGPAVLNGHSMHAYRSGECAVLNLVCMYVPVVFLRYLPVL